MLAVRKGFNYCNSALEVINDTIFVTFCAIFGEDWSTNTKDLGGSFCTFWDEMAKIDISYQIFQQVLDRTSQTYQYW